MAPRTRLIVNADDFGISPAVSGGIVEAWAAGTVSSTSVMVGCPGWDEVGARLASAPGLGVGLHFNLLVGAPLVASATLVNRRTGRFLSLAQLVRRALMGRVDPDEVEAECEAQLAAVASVASGASGAGAGRRPTHIDSHRHTHALPGVRRGVARVAARRGLALRRPVESHRRFPADVMSQMHRALIAGSWRATSLSAPTTRAPDNFIGVSMQGGVRFERQLTAVLDRLPAGTAELMVHPGRADAALATVDGYTWQRERELTALLSPSVRERLRAGDIALIDFSQI